MRKEYTIFKTKKKTVKVNNLTESPRADVFYDFSILDELKINNDILSKIKTQLMEYHTAGASWVNQPLPFSIQNGEFQSYACDIATGFTKVFKATGERLMVIVTVTSASIEKWHRQSIYDRYYEHEQTYKIDSDFSKGEYPDVEVA